MTPVEKMEQTRESNIIYKRTVLSNGSDKEEVLLGKDFTAENNKGDFHEMVQSHPVRAIARRTTCTF